MRKTPTIKFNKMKNKIFSIIAVAFLFIGCNQKSKQTETSNLEQTETASGQYACPMHPEVIGKKGGLCPVCAMELTEPISKTSQKTVVEAKAETKINEVILSSFTINKVVEDYLKLANALANDDSKAAAKVSAILSVTLNSLNPNELDELGKKKYAKISAVINEHLKHIIGNPADIDHQRAYFALLSKDMNDLIKAFGTDKKLYQAYCPMYEEGKSGYWISETKEIRNPYFGSQMLNCGSIVATVK